ncbi:MAG TPA: 16S rRNA (uracil(1498)-N(3))-methyltransferase [Clostridiaceae bacterium]
MNKFFVPFDHINDSKARIEGDDLRHIYKVLRLTVKDKIIINDSQGTEYLSEITEINKDNIIVLLKEKLATNNECNIDIHLFQGMPKLDKMDLVVQKAVELGIKSVTPLYTERVIVKLVEGEYKRLGRLQKIALEACKQSKRTLIPRVNKPINFNEFLSLKGDFDLIIVPYENEDKTGLKSILKSISKEKTKKIAVVIGPEGGFSEYEIESLKEVGAKIITLGPRILRTETAGLVCTSLLMYEFGDLGGINT